MAKVLKGSQAMLCAIDKSYLLETAFVQESRAHQLELAVQRQLVDDQSEAAADPFPEHRQRPGH